MLCVMIYVTSVNLMIHASYKNDLGRLLVNHNTSLHLAFNGSEFGVLVAADIIYQAILRVLFMRQ